MEDRIKQHRRYISDWFTLIVISAVGNPVTEWLEVKRSYIHNLLMAISFYSSIVRGLMRENAFENYYTFNE